MAHTFHIPVLGLGYSIDTPLKVSRYGISSVVSIVDDELIERMRAYHSQKNFHAFRPITKSEKDYRAKRITAYLNFMHELIGAQCKALKQQPFEKGTDLYRYFELLPKSSPLKQGFDLMMSYPEGESKIALQHVLRNAIKLGSIDVNIMAKVDKMNYVDDEYTGDVNTDALSALRGFAQSDLCASVILSAGMNPKLYSYIENFEDFFPDATGKLKKKIILKVSDFRSALIQAKFLAKKGLWVSEFRIESGLNCGGHAFATEGYLLGPILEEFKIKKEEMLIELFDMYQSALATKGYAIEDKPKQRISVQGGIGTAKEHDFLLEHYNLDATGWGSPFLLVPEVTNVDSETLNHLANAEPSDFYLSGASPLGVLFNNFRNSSVEQQRMERIEKGRPGSPCTKKYLCNNTEFTEQAICTASRAYQHLKIKSLKEAELSEAEYQKQFDLVTEKVCLCEGLCSSNYLKYDMIKPKENKAVAICPGPNLAYFSDVYSFDEMVGHIYGRTNLLAGVERPHVFIKELNLYIDYLQEDIKKQFQSFSDKKRKQLNNFKSQLAEGITYYKSLFSQISDQAAIQLQELALLKGKLDQIVVE
ncbi:hypothetical protein DHW03_02685 [Pedobacter yonginense]|uniref:Uncharacterized protein n=1 Tax=Pedobacter yonginense TaxID=651869 RepID=A0A317EU49_9SPHI|nr:hypothetical protein [Pedobacter yonginense]PWS28766.1 hypothetical protein DHW03_02685 [Pedobacter yonginense]